MDDKEHETKENNSEENKVEPTAHVHHHEKKDEVFSIDLKRIFNNKSVTIFFIIFLISLLVSIFSLTGVWANTQTFSKLYASFSTQMFFLLSSVLALSTILAYFRKFKLIFIPVIFWLLLTTALVRTTNIGQLIDVTTNQYTLGPDLDPFLYLRHAIEIDEGRLENPDVMRYAPLGVENYAKQNLMPWVIFYIYKIASIFKDISVTYAAIITSVILFIISTIGFMFLAKTLFSFKFSEKKSWVGAIVASIFYVSSTTLLHRTTAGIPELESLGLVWFWFAFLTFTLAWKDDKSKKAMTIYGILSGIFTGLMSWSWGGYVYVYMVIGLTTLVLFLFQKDSNKNFRIFLSWLIPAILLEYLRHRSLNELFTSVTGTGIALFVLFILIVDYMLFETKIKERIKHNKINLPRPIKSLIFSIVLLALFLIIFKRDFLFGTIKSVLERILYPFGRGRVSLTVAENRVPYFQEVLQSFGNLFWVFFFGALVLFYEATKKFKTRNKWTLNLLFILLMSSLVFNRYSPSSILNGDNFVSKFLYLGSLIFFIIFVIYLLIKAYIKKDEKTIEDFKEINFSYLFLLALAFIAIISMRGAIRLALIISPILPIITGFFLIKLFEYRENKEDINKLIATVLIVALISVLFLTFINYASSTAVSARSTVPSIYNQQWQKAMSWTRDNTIEGGVFVHWWDYGYWVQTIGERPTVTDGGHPIGYWDHLIGRYVLTTPYPETALSFMKTHKVSYLLIDPTDIGKYSAYSSIGNDEEKSDRYSWIPVMISDPAKIQETANGTVRIYQGGSGLDQDIIYEIDGKEILLPEGRAGIAGVVVEMKENNGSSTNFAQPQGVFVYNDNQIRIPLRYLGVGERVVDFGNGLDATLKVIPMVFQTNQGYQVDPIGAAMYLSTKTTNSLVGQLYILNDPFNKYESLELVHSEEDFTLASGGLSGFVYFNGLRGPIKIWKVDYPDNIIEREEFLRTSGSYGEFDDLEFTK